MDRVPPPRAGDPSARGRPAGPPDPQPRRILTPSHWVAIGMGVIVVAAVAVVAFVMTRTGASSPPDGTYRLVARDSALCLTAANTSSPATTTVASGTATTVRPVHLSTCPDAGGPLGAAATAPAAVVGRAPGVGGDGVDESDGTGVVPDPGTSDGGTGGGTTGDSAADPDGSTGWWAVGTTDGTAQRALHPADGADLCLTVTGRAAASPVGLEPCRSAGSQIWSLRQVGRSDYFQVVADGGRRCLDAKTVDGTLVAVEKMCSSEPSQQWRFDPAA